jgi:hypothetical protein
MSGVKILQTEADWTHAINRIRQWREAQLEWHRERERRFR